MIFKHAWIIFDQLSPLILLKRDSQIPQGAYVINSPIGRQQIDALSRQIIGQANVNSVELRGLQIPLPPLAVQEIIMERVADGRAEIAREQEAAERLSREITADMEALILGSKALRQQ